MALSEYERKLLREYARRKQENRRNNPAAFADEPVLAYADAYEENQRQIQQLRNRLNNYYNNPARQAQRSGRTSNASAQSELSAGSEEENEDEKISWRDRLANWQERNRANYPDAAVSNLNTPQYEGNDAASAYFGYINTVPLEQRDPRLETYYRQQYEDSLDRQQAERAQIETEQHQKSADWFAQHDAMYANITQNADFDANIEGWDDEVQFAQTTPEAEAYRNYMLYTPENMRDPELERRLREAAEASTAQQEADVFQMSDEQKQIYQYLRNTQGKKAAREYKDYISYEINAQSVENVRQAADYGEEDSGWDRVGRTILSSLANVLGSGFGALDILGQNIRNRFGEYRPVDYNRSAQELGEWAQAVREHTMDDMGDTGDFFYGVGTSMLDSWTAVGIGVLTGAPQVGTALLGLSAARQGMQDAAKAGATDTQAVAIGMFNGVAEFMMENIGIDNLYSILTDSGVKGFKNILRTILGQSFAEASEEGLTTLVNTMGDAVIMGDKSQINRMIAELVAQGMPEQEARYEAIRQWFGQLGMDMLAGGLSGAGSGGIGVGVNVLANIQNESQQTAQAVQTVENTAAAAVPAQEQLLTEPVTQEQRAEAQAAAASQGAQEASAQVEEETPTQERKSTQAAKAVSNTAQKTSATTAKKTRAMTVRDAGGNSVELVDVATGQDENLAFVTDDGKQISVDDINFDGAPKAMQIAEYAGRMNEDGARGLVTNYDGGDAVAYAREYTVVYERAKRNVPMQDAAQNIKGLSDAAIQAAYTAGQVERMANEGTQETRGGVIRSFTSSISETKERALEVLDAMASAIGRTLVVTDTINYVASDGTVRTSGSNAQFDPKTNRYTIALDAVDESYINVFAHETVHDIESNSPEDFALLREVVFDWLEQSGKDIEQMRQVQRDLAKGYDDAYYDAEIVANSVAAIFGERKTFRRFMDEFMSEDSYSHEHRRVFMELVDSVLEFIQKALDALSQYRSWSQIKALRQQRDMIEAVRDAYFAGLKNAVQQEAQGEGDTRNSIEYDEHNESFVVIDRDILANVPKSDWVSTVRENLKSRFPNGVEVAGRQIAINRDSRRELTFSDYMQWLQKNQPLVYADKLKVTDNADEIILASRNYVAEALNHPRKDTIVAFARGDVRIRVGSNDYDANVVVGTRKDGTMVLYDVIAMKPTKIVQKKKVQRTGRRDFSQSPAENAAPLRQRVTQTDSSVNRNIRSTEQRNSLKDDAYMSAVENGDMDTAQRMVDEAARDVGAITDERGRRPLKLFHGTDAFGFYEFVPGAVYTTTSPTVAAGYGKSGYAKPRSLSQMYVADDGTEETLIRNAKNVLDWELTPLTDEYRTELRQVVKIESGELSAAVNDVWTGEAVDALSDVTVEIDNDIAWVFSLPGSINDNIDDIGEYIPLSEIESWLDRFDESLPRVREFFSERRSKLKNTPAWGMAKLALGYELNDFAIDARYKLLKSFESDLLVNASGNLVSAETVRNQVENAKNIGAYTLYGFEGDNPLVIDGNGAIWFGVRVPQWGEVLTTDDIVRRAKEEGYTSVRINNIVDVAMNNYSANVRSDIFAFFDSEQVKSADPVTYDDNGDVIPLSKRFNPEQQDIRYSIKEGMSEEERYDELKDAQLQVATFDADAAGMTQEDVDKLLSRVKNEARDHVRTLFSKFKVIKRYTHESAEIEFDFSMRGARESLSQQQDRRQSFMAFAKMLGCFDEIISNAIPIEIHADKYKDTSRENRNLKRTYVFVSAYEDEGIIPVQLEVKEYRDTDSKLYVAVTMTKIKEGVLATAVESDVSDGTSSVALPSVISIRELFKNVNPENGDFLKYVPDQFLDDEQIASKREALERERVKIDSYRYSAKDVDVEALQAENAQLRAANAELAAQMKRTKGVNLDERAIRRFAQKLVKREGSTFDADQLANSLSLIYDDMANADDLTDEDAARIIQSGTRLARQVLEQARYFDQDSYDADSAVREFLRDTAVEIPAEYDDAIKRMATSRTAYRAQTRGVLNIVGKGKGVSIEQLWQSGSEDFPTVFSENVTNPEDMVEKLFVIAQGLKKDAYFGDNPYANDLDTAANILFLEMQAELMNIPRVQTLADKAAEAAKANRRAASAEKAAERSEQRRAVTQERYEAKKTELADVRARNAERREDANRRKYRDRVTRTANSLYQWAAKPNSKNYIPETMRLTVVKMLRALDMEGRMVEEAPKPPTHPGENATKEQMSAYRARETVYKRRLEAYQTKTQAKTTQSILWEQRMLKFADEMQKARGAENGASSFAASTDPDLPDAIRNYFKENPHVHLATMNAAQMKELSKLLSRIEKAVTSENKRHAEYRNQTIAQTAADTKTAWREREEANETVLGKISTSKLAMAQMDAMNTAHMLGGGAQSIIQELRDGEDVFIEHVEEAKQVLEPEIKKLNKGRLSSTKVVQTPEGKYTHAIVLHSTDGDVTLTRAQVMSLYCLNKREQARGHLYGGGIVSTRDGKKKTYRLTEQQVQEACGHLTDTERGVADVMQNLLSTVCAEWGNEATMELYGYKKFREKFYFPISTVELGRDVAYDPNASETTIAQRGFSQSTQDNATNAIYIGDVLTVVSKHVADMAEYGAYLTRISDAMRWLNYRGYTDADGTNYVNVKAELVRAFPGKEHRSGKDADKSAMEVYITDLIRSINGGASRTGTSNAITRLAKGAAVGANVSVAIQQPASYARAGVLLSARDLAFAKAGLLSKKERDLMYKYAPITRWKSYGFFQAGTGRNVEALLRGDDNFYQTLREKQGLLAEAADNNTWLRLWNACKHEQKRLHKDMDHKSDEFYRLVGKRLSEVIDRTQVVDSPFHRAPIVNDSRYVTLTAFQSEVFKSFGVAQSCTYDVVLDPKSKKTWKALGKGISAHVTAQILAGWLAAAWSAFIRDKDEEKDDELVERWLIKWGWIKPTGKYTRWEKFLVQGVQRSLGNLNPMRLHWIGNKVSDVIENGFAGAFFGNDSVDSSFFNAISKFIAESIKLVAKRREGEPTDPTNLIGYGLQAGSYGSGLGVATAIRDANGIYRLIKDILKPEAYAPTMDDVFYYAETGVNEDDMSQVLAAETAKVQEDYHSYSADKAEREARGNLRSDITHEYKDVYVQAFIDGDTETMQQIKDFMTETGLYIDGNDPDDACKNWLRGGLKTMYLEAATDEERQEIYDIMVNGKVYTRSELNSAIRSWTE